MRLCASVFLLLPSCTPTSGSPVAKPMVHVEPAVAGSSGAPAIDRGVIARAGEPLVLPLEAESAAPWLEEPLVGSPQRPTFEATTVASGFRATVVRTPAGQYVGFHADVGAVGVIAVPDETIWLGFGKDDELLAATRRGTVYASTGSWSHWTERGTVANATVWDSAPGVLAASDGRAVWASLDGGRTFSPPFTGEQEVRQVLVRMPATVVIEATSGEEDARVWVSADAGTQYAKATLRPTRLHRDGPWIWNRSWNCAAVLSSDNQTWVEPTGEAIERAFNTHSWMAFLQTTDSLDGYDTEALPDWATPTYPEVPTLDSARRQIRGVRPCLPHASAQSVYAVGNLLASLTGSELPDCSGIECLRSNPAPAPATTVSGFYLLRDARCALDEDRGGCRTDVPLGRPPHTAFVNHRDGSVVIDEIPKACTMPVKIFAAHGLGVLLCRGQEGTEIWTVDASHQWAREHGISGTPHEFWNAGSAPDGTLLLQRACPREAQACSATLRRPVPVGAEGAWYDLREEGALTQRPIVGGRVLLVASDGGKLDVSLAAGPGQQVVLSSGFASERRIEGLTIDSAGRLQLSGGGWSGYLTPDGMALESNPTPPPAVFVPTPVDPSHID